MSLAPMAALEWSRFCPYLEKLPPLIHIGNMGRQFIAITPTGLESSAELKQLLSKLKRTMKERGQEVRWTAPDLWHITLQFLGDLSEAETGRVRSVLEGWVPAVDTAFTLRIQGVGAFPANEEARVLWLGVQENQRFLDLQADLGARLQAVGVRPSEREFKPHLTLARFRNLINVSDLVQLGGRKRFGDYPIKEAVLFESVLQGNIIKYLPQLRRSLQ